MSFYQIFIKILRSLDWTLEWRFQAKENFPVHVTSELIRSIT